MQEHPQHAEQATSSGDWAQLLELVISGQVHITLTTPSGQDAVVIAASDLAELQRAAAAARSRAGHVVLTPREREVLSHIAAGDSTSQVADRLGLAIGTVTSHLATARRKYGVHSSAVAAEHAREDLGLRVAPEEE